MTVTAPQLYWECQKCPELHCAKYVIYRTTMTHADGTGFICKTLVPRAIWEPLSIQNILIGLTDTMQNLWMTCAFLEWLLEVTRAAPGYLKWHWMSTYRHLDDTESVWMSGQAPLLINLIIHTVVLRLEITLHNCLKSVFIDYQKCYNNKHIPPFV